MDKFVIRGGTRLSGTIAVSGAKNASLALMPAALLSDGTCTFHRTPHLRDITTMSRLLESMGAVVSRVDDQVTIDCARISHREAPYELVKQMRASFYVLGPLVARYGEAKVSYPGGCAWGPRPVDLHLEGLKKLGAEIELESGYVMARAKRLHGARIAFDVSSVGATGNILMAAVLAKGTTVIQHAAMEPEITHLASFLIRMGAHIEGVGTNTLEIEGRDALGSAEDHNIPDRIEAATFLAAAAITRGSVTLEHCDPRHLAAILARLEDAGCSCTTTGDSITLRAPDIINPVDIVTGIYPGFPTDMQAQWIALMSIAAGTATITDSIYFDRFSHVPELQRLGAKIRLNENIAVVHGVPTLHGAKVMSTDLRASASLILAGLVAEGTTEVLRVYHIDRGYEQIEKKLGAMGASIQRIHGEEY